ncbi:MAG: hypothetical protein ACK5BV_01690 [Bacteroidota bacterium]
MRGSHFCVWAAIFTIAAMVMPQDMLAQNRMTADTVRPVIPMNRMLWHEQLDKEQKRIDKIDGKSDGVIKLLQNEDINVQIEDAIFRRVDELQLEVERRKTDHNSKIGYLRGLKELLLEYQKQVKMKRSMAVYAPVLIESFDSCMQLMSRQESVVPVIQSIPYQAAEPLLPLFYAEKDLAEIKKVIFLKKAKDNPKNILLEIAPYENESFADSLIIEAALNNPMDIYTYAQASKSAQARMIRRSQDPRVLTIAKLSEKLNGTLFLPFLDEFISGNISLDSVSAVTTSPATYYRLLVQTQIRYQQRLTAGDTILMASALLDMLKRQATDAFVNVMNELHDATETVRFRVAEGLTAQEIYYLLVSTEEVIYTSTYTNLFKRMMDRSPGKRADSLLMSVNMDRFKKFIKMAANYNRLDEFLKAMPELRSRQLMYAFANGLQKTNSLEDAVDVADSYGSIVNVELKDFLKTQIQVNYEKSMQAGDKRGTIIYRILHTLFQSSEDSTINLSAELGIPSVYRVDYESLADDSGRVVQQVFFYGDEDGMTSYKNFMGMFQSKTDWDVVKGTDWVTIHSLKGKPYTIYANLPLDHEQDLDQKAQENLLNYLSNNHIMPSIVVHRGHSYHLKYTIRQMMSSSRIVMLGSCGGYQNLAKILNVNEDAHIISTKQVGSYSVNEPILRQLNENVRNGKHIEWIPLWDQVNLAVKNDPKASTLIKDYVPPHKNLGALFIKAYRKVSGEG